MIASMTVDPDTGVDRLSPWEEWAEPELRRPDGPLAAAGRDAHDKDDDFEDNDDDDDDFFDDDEEDELFEDDEEEDDDPFLDDLDDEDDEP